MTQDELNQNYLTVDDVRVAPARLGGLPYLEVKLFATMPLGGKAGLRSFICLN